MIFLISFSSKFSLSSIIVGIGLNILSELGSLLLFLVDDFLKYCFSVLPLVKKCLILEGEPGSFFSSFARVVL